MRINIHAGHNPDGMAACGAVGLISESTEARKVKDKAVSYLRKMGHTVYDCTCSDGENQRDVLEKIVGKCNAREVDIDVSVHFNAGGKGAADGETTGTEVLVASQDAASAPYARKILEKIAGIGFRGRGVKERPGLYYLKHAKSPALLVECCFVDDPDDVAAYDAGRMAAAIAEGITGQPVQGAGDADRLAAMGREEFVEYIGAVAAKDMRESGILASVTAAQAILESGYGKSELALQALNLGGMKARLSGNTWASEWDGTVYQKWTAEQLEDGSYMPVLADFRSYPSVAAYIADHSAYLAGARMDGGLRYGGIAGCRDYRRAFQILKDGGYASSHNYVENLCRVVEEWNLTRFDGDLEPGVVYTVSVADVWTRAQAEEVQRMLEGIGTIGVVHKVQILE